MRDRFDNIRMDYIDKTNLIGDSRWSDRLTYDGTWENNLFNFFTRIIPKLTADLKRPFKLEGMERIDDIMNGGNSKARNPRIQNMLCMIGFGDNIGNTELQQLLGLNSIEVGKILHQMVDKQLLNKENKNRRTTYTLLKDGNVDSTSEEKSEEKNDKKASDKKGDKKTDVTDNVTDKDEEGQKGNLTTETGSETKDLIINIIKQNQRISAAEIAKQLCISSRGVEKQIRKLREYGIIRRKGGRFGGYWEILQQ